MELKEPFKIYTAATNVEAHIVVDMLRASGIEAFAEEDQSGVSLWAFGTISQFHQPNVWVDKSTSTKAAQLIHQFEERKRQRAALESAEGSEIQAACEDCGKTSLFPKAMNGTTQDCPHCGAYMDVGALGWDDDFGEPTS